MQQLSDTLRSFGDMLTTLADNISNTGGDELIESRYKLLYTLARHQNAMQKETFSIASSVILPKLSKVEDELNTANIIIRTQAHAIQDKERVIQGMESYHDEIVDGYKLELEHEKNRYTDLLVEFKDRGMQIASLETKLHNLQANQADMIKNAELKKDCEINNLKQKLLDANNQISTLRDCAAFDQGRIKRQADKTNHWMKQAADYKKKIEEYEDRIEKLEKEKETFTWCYSSIMLLPEGVEPHWSDAKVISQEFLEIDNKRYVVRGKGLILNRGYATIQVVE
jgi:chromosome segregation ATPase